MLVIPDHRACIPLDFLLGKLTGSLADVVWDAVKGGNELRKNGTS